MNTIQSIIDSIVTPNPDWPDNKTEFDQDPVALGCAAYRIWHTDKLVRFTEFERIQVLPEDIEMANNLCDYYISQTTNLLFDAIRNSDKVSEFRKKMTLIVHRQMVDFTLQDRGILYKLPYFYHEDTALTRVFKDNKEENYFLSPTRVRCELNPLERILISRKHGDTVQFWFTTQSQPGLFMWPVQTSNPMLRLVEGLFRRPSMVVETDIHLCDFYNVENSSHLKMNGMEIVNV